jgi:AAA family ATP:ADP antiporter
MSVARPENYNFRPSRPRATNELQLTLLLFLFSFLISGIPRVYTQTASYTLFIEAYGAGALPWAYLAQSICIPLAGYIYIHAERRLNLAGLQVCTLGFQVISLILFRIGNELEIPYVAAASIVYFEIEFVFSSLLLWGLSNQLMTLRQGKRRFGIVSAGEPLAIIIFGLSMPLLLRWVQPADLFLLSALANGTGIVLVLLILRRHRPVKAISEQETDQQEDGSVANPWWRSRYIVTMVWLVIIGQLAYYFLDNAFYVEAGKRYANKEDLASFLGIYSAIVGMVSLTCSILLTPWLLRRFGVRGGLLTLPVMVSIGAAAAVLAGLTGSPANLLFLLVVVNKVIDQSFRYTVDKTTFITLFQPLPPEQRMRVQAGLESMVEPITGGIAGLLLFVMINVLGFGAVGITGVTLLVACLWIGLVAVQYRGYLGSLRAALSRRLISSKNLSLEDSESRSILRHRLLSSSSSEVLYCLSLMDSIELPLDLAEVSHLLHHDSAEVRSEIARRIESGTLMVPFHTLRSAIATESDDQVKSLLIEGFAATGQDVIAEFAPWLDDPSESIQLGAAVGLMRHGGIEGVLEVGPRLLQSAPLRSSFDGGRWF